MSDLIRKNSECSNVATMSSLEIAEITVKQHKHVMRDIKKMFEELGLDEPSFGLIYQDSMGRNKRCFNLNKELTLTLVSGYDIGLRHKVITRLAKLESEVAKPSDPMKVLSDPATLRGLLLSYTEKTKAMEARLEDLEPKEQALNRISQSKGSYCITDAAKVLNLKPKMLFDCLSQNKWIYRRFGNTAWTGYQDKIQSGLIEQKVMTIESSDGSDKTIEQARITPKGMVRLAMLLNGDPTPQKPKTQANKTD